jgi:biopolymer transport protein ExbD
MRRRRHDMREEEAEVNMTPMLDIVFIMLIFFVVTSSFVKESGVDVSRPAATTAQRKEQGNIMIGITEDNQIWIDRQRVDERAVRATVARLHAESPGGAVVIQADRHAHAGLLVQVIDQSRAAGVEDVSIAAEVATDTL